MPTSKAKALSKTESQHPHLSTKPPSHASLGVHRKGSLSQLSFILEEFYNNADLKPSTFLEHE